MTRSQPEWNTMSTQMLLERAWALSQRHNGSEAARCIDALIWRLKGAEEWNTSQARRPRKESDDRQP